MLGEDRVAQKMVRVAGVSLFGLAISPGFHPNQCSAHQTANVTPDVLLGRAERLADTLLAWMTAIRAIPARQVCIQCLVPPMESQRLVGLHDGSRMESADRSARIEAIIRNVTRSLYRIVISSRRMRCPLCSRSAYVAEFGIR
jgi:hypothetical protein